jgi:UDP-2-acetamido-3-amino-2,3-dideoxy-glucuronate N-acetyltransferase
MKTSIIYDNVTFGSGSEVDDFCMIGVPPDGATDGGLPTKFGERARIMSHSIIYSGNEFGDDFFVGHGTYLRNGNWIGDRVEIGAKNVWEGQVTVANDVNFGPYTGISEGSVIGSGVVIGQRVGLAGVLHPLSGLAKETQKGATIGDGVTIMAGCNIGPGLRIGAGAYVERGAVVLRDVRPFAVVAGNPAKEVGDVRELHPEVLQHVEKYADTSDDAVEALRREFDAVPTDFPPRRTAK